MADNGEVYRAGLPMLGARLLAAARMVRPGGTVADIGCDHGRLAVWLAKRGGAQKVIAVDSRPLPLAGAKALVRQTGCGDVVDCRLGDGLCALAPGEAGQVVIAGLSAETMAGILEKAPWVAEEKTRLVLVPASRHDHLRRWLCQSGFGIEEETPVLEKGRCYTALAASYTGLKHTPEVFFCHMGLVPQSADKAAVRAYARARLRNLHKQAEGLDGAALAQHRQLISEVEACLL